MPTISQTYDVATSNVEILKTITLHPVTGLAMTDAMCDGSLLVKNTADGTYQQRILPNSTVDVKELGLNPDGVTDNLALFTMQLPLLALTGTRIVITAGSYYFSDSFTIPEDVELDFMKGGMLVVPDGKTVTVNGKMSAGLFQVFSATGEFLLYKTKTVVPQWWGAKGDDSNHDSPAIQKALDCMGKVGGGKVHLPAGIYQCYHLTQPSYYQGRLVMNYSKVVFEGDGRSATVLKFLGTNGVDPQTNWDIDTSYNQGFPNSMRSPGLLIQSLASETLADLVIRGIKFDGGVDATGDHHYPSSSTTGDGWDLSYKGILFYGDGVTHTDNALIENCEVSRWRGENIWSGGTFNTNTRILDSVIHTSNGSMISGAFKEVSRCELYNGVNGLENYPGPQRGFYLNNYIHDISGNGIVHGGSTATVLDCRDFLIDGNIIDNCAVGVFLTREIMMTSVSNNILTDNGVGVKIQPQGYSVVHDIFITSNAFRVIDVNASSAISIFEGNAARNIHIMNNIMETSIIGISNGKSLSYGIYYFGTVINGDIYVSNNFFKGQAFLCNAGIGPNSPGVLKNLIVSNNTVIENPGATYLGDTYGAGLPVEQANTTILYPYNEVSHYYNYYHIIPVTLDAGTANTGDRRKIVNDSSIYSPGTFKYKATEPNLSIAHDLIQPPKTSVTWEFNGSQWKVFELDGAYYDVPALDIYDTSGTNYTLATLNAAYPSAVTGTTIYQDDKLLKYIKTATNWEYVSYAILS